MNKFRKVGGTAIDGRPKRTQESADQKQARNLIKLVAKGARVESVMKGVLKQIKEGMGHYSIGSTVKVNQDCEGFTKGEVVSIVNPGMGESGTDSLVLKSDGSNAVIPLKCLGEAEDAGYEVSPGTDGTQVLDTEVDQVESEDPDEDEDPGVIEPTAKVAESKKKVIAHLRSVRESMSSPRDRNKVLAIVKMIESITGAKALTKVHSLVLGKKSVTLESLKKALENYIRRTESDDPELDTEGEDLSVNPDDPNDQEIPDDEDEMESEDDMPSEDDNDSDDTEESDDDSDEDPEMESEDDSDEVAAVSDDATSTPPTKVESVRRKSKVESSGRKPKDMFSLIESMDTDVSRNLEGRRRNQ